MRLFLLGFVLLTNCFAFADIPVIEEPKPKYAADYAKEEKKLSKEERARLRKLRAPLKVDPQNKKPNYPAKDPIKDENRSDLTPPE